MSSPAPLPKEIHRSAQRGELQKVVKWLRKGGLVDAVCPTTSAGLTIVGALLHVASSSGQLEMVRELLKRGASIDLPSSLGDTPLMRAAYNGHLSVVLILLQHLANPDLQSNEGGTALMAAANQGQAPCVKALLRAKASTELLDEGGNTALQWAENKGHTTTAALIRQHAAPPPPPATTSPAATPDAGEPAESAPAPLPKEIHRSAQWGELQKVVKWLRKGGAVDAFCSTTTKDGRVTTVALLNAAAAYGHLEMVSC